VRPEPTQKGNPHQLTIQQHVFPRASIKRFAGADGKVSVRLSGKIGEQRRYPSAKIFCAERVWDQRSEARYMKDIEDEFLALVEQIATGLESLGDHQNRIATKFFALWSLRAQFEQNPTSDQFISGVAGESLTTDQQERLEKTGVAYIRADQAMPGRFLAGLQIQTRIDYLCVQFQGMRWGIVKANEGEFICPDTFGQLAAIPLTPTVCLYLGHQDSTIPKLEVATANRVAQQLSRKYCIARDFAACPL